MPRFVLSVDTYLLLVAVLLRTHHQATIAALLQESSKIDILNAIPDILQYLERHYDGKGRKDTLTVAALILQASSDQAPLQCCPTPGSVLR